MPNSYYTREMMTDTDKTVTLKTLNRIARIDEFKGRWESLGQLVPGRLKALQRIATMESAAAMGRLKDIKNSDRHIGEFLAGRDTATSLSSEEQAVIHGFHNVLQMVNDSYDQVSFIENHVLQMHDLIIKGNGAQPDQASSATEQLSELIAETTAALDEGVLHPLLVAADFSYRFWHMRPFRKGSERLTWLLTRLLLLRSDYAYLPFGSIEHFLEGRLADYKSQRKFTFTGQPVDSDEESWLDMFLDAMLKMQDNISAKIRREKELLRLKPPHLEIIRVVQEHGQSNISGIMAATNMNRNTLKIRLRKLAGEKYLVQHGRGKSTYYTLPDLHFR